MNKKNEINYNDDSNLGISTDKSSTKEELTTTIPTSIKKDMAENVLTILKIIKYDKR